MRRQRVINEGRKAISASEVKWRLFVADPTLRAYIIAFCSVAPARATDIERALDADDVVTALDTVSRGQASAVQCLAHLMDYMARVDAVLSIGRAIIDGHEYTVYAPAMRAPYGAVEFRWERPVMGAVDVSWIRTAFARTG